METEVSSNVNVVTGSGEFTIVGDAQTRGRTTLELEYEWTFNFTDGFNNQIGPCIVGWTPAKANVSNYINNNPGCSDFNLSGVGYSVSVAANASRVNPIFLEYCLRVRDPNTGIIADEVSCNSAGEKASSTLNFYVRQDCTGAPGPCWNNLGDFDTNAVSDSILLDKDLVAHGLNIIVHIDQAWTVADSSIANIQGWTTSASSGIRIQTEGVARHNGLASGNRYRMESNPSPAHIVINSDHVTLDGLEISGTLITGSSKEGIRVNANNTVIANMLIHDFNLATTNTDAIHLETNGGNLDNSTTTVYNLLAYNMGRSCVWLQAKGFTSANNIRVNVYNSTCYNVLGNASSLNYGVFGSEAFQGTFIDVVFDVRNSIAILDPGHGATHSAYFIDAGTTWHVDTGNNFSDDATAPGLNSEINIDATATAPLVPPANPTVVFNNLGAGTIDLHVQNVTHNSTIGGGADLSSIFTTDIDGDTISTWHVGVDNTP